MCPACPSMKVIDGWPCISESLQWAEGCPLYLMGQYTALQVGIIWGGLGYKNIGLNNNLYHYFPHTQVGPHAVNLAGGQAASMRIAKDIMRRQQQDNAEASELSGEKSKTEEYIKQMQGLLWL